MGILTVVGFANVLTAATLVFIGVSFATDHWVVINVQRQDLKTIVENYNDPGGLNNSLYNDERYANSERGLFRTCYPGSETLFLDDVEDDHLIGGHCIQELGYELSRREETTGYGDDYETRIHLMRCHFSFLVVSILLLVIGFVFGAFSCWNHKITLFRGAGVCVFLAAFFIGGGMAFFHGYEYLEKQKIDESPFYKSYSKLIVQGTRTLGDYLNWSYGFSYMLAWIAMAVGAIAAILYLVAAFQLAKENRHQKRPLRDEYSRRNKAYEHMAEQQRYMEAAAMAQGMGPPALPAYPTMAPTMASTYPDYSIYKY